MLQFADALPMPSELTRLGVSKRQLVAMRARRFDLMIAMVSGGILPEDIGSSAALEYVQGTYPQRYNLGLTKDNPTPKVFAQRCHDWLALTPHVSGLMLDTPFMNVTQEVASQGVKDMVAANPASIIMPNFGDAATWMGENHLYRDAALEMYQACRWHLVEVAVDLSKPFDDGKFRAVRSRIEHAVDVDGKRVVAGIYDPEWKQAQLAYGIAATIQHPRVLWLYKAAQAANYDQLWNPWYTKTGWRI